MLCNVKGKEVLPNLPFSLNLTEKKKLRPLGNQGPSRAENNVNFLSRHTLKMLATVPQRSVCKKISKIIFLPRNNSIYLLHHKNNIMEILQTTIAEITKVQIPSKTEGGTIITDDYERIEHLGGYVEWRHAGSDTIIKKKELELLEVAFQQANEPDPAETLSTLPNFVKNVEHQNFIELYQNKMNAKRNKKILKKLSKREKKIYYGLFDFMD